MLRLAVLSDFWPLTALAFVIAAISVAYYRFTQPGEVLAWWARVLYSLRDRYVGITAKEFYEGDQGPDRADYYAERHQRADYFLKPILTCEKCIAGQMALWVCVFTTPFDVVSWLYVIALSSGLATWIFNRLQA